MDITNTTNWKKIWEEQRNHFYATIYNNYFIPEKPFGKQVKFLIYPSEEMLFGGRAGGGKSSSLLMSALQYVEEKHIPEGENKLNYNALIIRRTLEDLDMPNAIMDRAKQWLLPKENSGLVVWKEQKKRFIFSSGATLTFRYLSHDKHLNSYQGAELQFVGFDELTQFPENQYNYLHSRLRKLENNDIPIRMRGASNPGGIGHDWVKKRFVDKKSRLPFISSAFTDNMYLNHEEYSKQLDKLDNLTRQQLKFGNWDLVLSSGLLMDLETYNQRLIPYEQFKDWKPVYTTIGIDPASTGTDRFSMSCLSYFDNGKIVLVDLDSTTSPTPEQRLINFILRNKPYKPRVVNFEREQGSSPKFALNYWRNLLASTINPMGCYVTDTPASSTGSKYNRAYPVAYHIRNGTMLINKDIPLIYDNPSEPYDPIREYGNQLVYLNPDKEVMKDFRSPDESDSVSYAFEKLQQTIGGLALE